MFWIKSSSILEIFQIPDWELKTRNNSFWHSDNTTQSRTPLITSQQIESRHCFLHRQTSIYVTRNHEMFLAEFFPPDFWHSSQIIEIWLFPFRGIGRWEFKDVGGHNLETGSLLCCLDNWRHLQWFTGWKGFIIGGSFEIRKVIVGEWKWFRGFPLINLGTDCLVCLKIANPHNYIEHWELQIRFELEWFISYTLVEKTFNIWSSSHPFT